ncbi:MAG: hypothetical protein U1E97_02375 [Alphaproteobacteria bacterium]
MMRPASKRGQPVRSLATWLAVLALAIQTLIPPLHQAAQAMGGQAFLSRLVVLCTAEGPKVVSIADHGDAPEPQAPPTRTQTCVLCIGHQMADASLLPGAAHVVDRVVVVAHVTVPAASLSGNGIRHSPQYPRGPPGQA